MSSNPLANSNSIIPLSLYIHIPWCLKKCPYCDFNSHEYKNKITSELEDNYIKSLIIDLTESLNFLSCNNTTWRVPKIHSLFIGGGTPNLFSANSIGNLLNKINNFFPIPNDCEITLEANPGAFEASKFKDFKSIGINRLSIGAQSFNNDSLKLLGRVHDKDEAIRAITMAKRLNFNVNLDLMHGLPEQELQSALDDLKTAVNFEPNHISWYQLTIEPNTQFAKQPPELPKENILNNIYNLGTNYLIKHNYVQYEISAFTRHSLYKSSHNLNYWHYGDYIGIGAGAHSKLTYNKPNTSNNIEIIRQWKQKSPTRYLNNNINKISGDSKLTEKEIILEYMMNRLRLFEPMKEAEFYFYTKLKFSNINPKILKQAQDKNWLVVQKEKIKITKLGHRFLNDLVLLFV